MSSRFAAPLFIAAGLWLALPGPRFAKTSVAGIALAVAGGLLIVATHWGHFG